MPFERLLFTACLLPGVYIFKENNTYVEIKPEEGETILFFGIDPNSKGHINCKDCKLRDDLWGKKEGECICDLLVFYARGERRVLCFVELKDNKEDRHHATDQVINTYNALKSRLKLSSHYTIQAFLTGEHGGSPMQAADDQKRLQNVFKGNYIYDGKPGKFAEFIRSGKIPFHHQSKKKLRKS